MSKNTFNFHLIVLALGTIAAIAALAYRTSFWVVGTIILGTLVLATIVRGAVDFDRGLVEMTNECEDLRESQRIR